MQKGKSTKAFLMFLFFVFCPKLSFQQETAPPYLTAATLFISVDDWADVWLNGIPIVDSLKLTPASKGFKTVKCIPEHLCYFKGENVLAIENSKAYRKLSPGQDYVGIAYVLILRFSDGSLTTISSNDLSNHKSFYIPDREMGEPKDWHKTSFYDGNWVPAQATGKEIPGVATLDDPGTFLPLQFLSATGPSYKARFPGERHLYRRKFFLNISQNPFCAPVTVEKRMMPESRVPFVPPTHMPTPWPSPTPTPCPTPTFTFLPVQVEPLTPTPFSTPIYRVWPTNTSTWAPTSTPIPTYTPISTPTSQMISMPKKRRRILPKPTVSFGVESRVDPIQKNAPPVPVTAIPTTVPTFTPTPGLSQALTIVFDKQPANIYIRFADGPGVYRLEVFDETLHHLKNLYDKKVVALPDDWVEWDGTDDNGSEVPPGRFLVVFSKDGKPLNRIIVVKFPTQ